MSPTWSHPRSRPAVILAGKHGAVASIFWRENLTLCRRSRSVRRRFSVSLYPVFTSLFDIHLSQRYTQLSPISTSLLFRPLSLSSLYCFVYRLPVIVSFLLRLLGGTVERVSVEQRHTFQLFSVIPRVSELFSIDSLSGIDVCV